MKIQELRNKELEDLKKELQSLRKVQFGLRLQHKTQQLLNTSQICNIRRDIARIKTILGERLG